MEGGEDIGPRSNIFPPPHYLRLSCLYAFFLDAQLATCYFLFVRKQFPIFVPGHILDCLPVGAVDTAPGMLVEPRVVIPRENET